MPEPVASGLSAFKLVGLLIVGALFVALAYLIVILFELPRNAKEWVVSLASTIGFSLGGGSMTLMYFELGYLVDIPHPFIGWCAIGFVLLLWGLIGWWLIRVLFTTMVNNKDNDIFQIGKKIRGLIFGENGGSNETGE